MDLLIRLLPLAACLVSCSGPPEDETTGGAGELEPSHPWDWVPGVPELVEGRRVYLAECALCHNEGEEGAPPLNRGAEWALRTEKGIEALISNAIDGFIGDDGEMPARGGTDSLSDEEVALAVRYMVATPKRGGRPPSGKNLTE